MKEGAVIGDLKRNTRDSYGRTLTLEATFEENIGALADRIQVSFFDGKLFAVALRLRPMLGEQHEALRSALIAKYGNPERSPIDVDTSWTLGRTSILLHNSSDSFLIYADFKVNSNSMNDRLGIPSQVSPSKL